MSVKELVFKYTTDGAKAAQRADQKVRESVRETGRTADQQSGKVERWMTANKRAIQGLAAATLGAAGAIVSASPTMRAELSGVRTAFSLFADQIVRDLLPGTGSLAEGALNLAKKFGNLDKGTRKIVGGLIAFGSAIAAIGVTIGGVAAAVVAGFTIQIAAISKFLQTFGALNNVINMWMNAGKAVVAFLRGNFGKAWDYAKQAVGQAMAAVGSILGTVWQTIKDVVSDIRSRVSGVVDDAIDWGKNLIGDIRQGIEDRISKLRDKAAEVRDDVISRASAIVDNAKQWGKNLINDIRNGIGDRLSKLRDKASEMAGDIKDAITDLDPLQWGKNLVQDLIDGFKNKLSELKQAGNGIAGAISDRLQGQSPPPKGPLSDIDDPGIVETVANGMDKNANRVAQSANRFAGSMGGMTQGTSQNGPVNVTIEQITIQGTGNSRKDGEKVGQEASEYIGRSLGSRGA